MKKQLFLLAMILLPMVANADDSGSCGDNVYFTYSESTRTLTITGDGAMSDYGFGSLPWYSYCTSIEHVVIENGITSICDWAFYACENAKTITLSNNIKTIGRGAFEYCSSLTELTIPKSVTTIGMSAFDRCTNLKSINIPNSLEVVGEDAFSRCDGLERVYISDITSWVNISFSNALSNPLYEANHLYIGDSELTSVSIPEGVTSINSYVFAGGRNITAIDIPNSVTSIGIGAFYGCFNLIKISIPSGLTSINANTFGGCNSLVDINIPEGVTSIGRAAFYSCSSLVNIILPSNLTSIGESAFYGCHSLTDITIPFGIIKLERETFNDCYSLNNIIIPSSVTSIGDLCFYRCKNFTEIMIPEGVTSIGSCAFEKCNNLKKVQLPNNLTSIDESVFKDCENLTDIIFPQNILSIGNKAFMNCGQLFSIQFSEKLNSIGNSAFENCINLTEVTIPNKVIDIGSRAFYGCKKLKSISLPEELSIIKYESFCKCSKLESITIPSSVEIIYQKALAECSSLTIIIALPTTPPFLYDNSFSNFSVPLKVPKGCKEAYQTAQGWKNFTNITDEADKYKLTYILDGEEYKTYEIEEGSSITPEPAPTKEGYTFSGWSEIPETMPSHDVTVTGSFIINKYKLAYMVDGAEYKSYEIEFGATITPEPAPTKEGYTFSGWSEIPETMPAHDVTVTGSFTINKYKLTYIVDDAEYKSYDIEFGATITPEPAPEKEGYTFSDWSEIPETMPAHDVTVTGSFTINKYKLIYMVDEIEYKSYEIEFGATITPEPAPTKEGYKFSGWSEIPETMPAHDVTVSGTFEKIYKLTYLVDNEEYKTYELIYGETITPEPAPEQEGYTFSGWSEIPETMPAHDVTVTGSFAVNQYTITYIIEDEVYFTETVDYGSTIVPPTAPEREGYVFAWDEYPETMPAQDVTITGTYTKKEYDIDGTTYQVNGDEAVVINGKNCAGKVVIPSTIEIDGKKYDVTAIGDNAFTWNMYITSVTISDGIKKIGANAFNYCIQMVEIIIGKDVSVIGNKAFANIITSSNAQRRTGGGLKVSCYAETLPETASDAFEYSSISNGTLLVDDNIVNDYKTTEPWSQFGTIMGFNEASGVKAVWANEDGDAQIFSLDGKSLNTPKKGVNILRMSDGKPKKIVVK